jgi:N-hydroxyarylamine O-acetyltransferase
VAPLGDLEGYLARLGIDATASLAEVHRAHATTIPFENFESFEGRPVRLDVASLEDKLVARRRGGYCFEHNLLLAAALESLGAEVAPLLARVRMGPEGVPRPLDHLALRVVADHSTWLCDVGFGGGTLLEPLRFEAGAEADQRGWRYRLEEVGHELVLQVFQDGGWSDAYGFVPEPVPLVDVEVANWYTSTHPTSLFVTGLVLGARREDRLLTMLVHDQATLIEREVDGPSVLTELDLAAAPSVLSSRFGLDGVVVGTGGRLAIGERA